MDLATLATLRRRHPAWKLLRSDNADVVVSFLHSAFVSTNTRTLPQAELAGQLEDFLFSNRSALEDRMRGKATDYLTKWANNEHGWLRRYYDGLDDEPRFDLTPATEFAIEWVVSLQATERFVGTESRLNTIFDLLRQIVRGVESDPDIRVAQLRSQREAIDRQISEIQGGDVPLLEPAQVRERFYQVEQTARALLTDFRQLDQNFRDLDRNLREQIAQWDGTKGALLDELFGDRDAISDSDQGQSFRAFWDFLMSPARTEELENLLEEVQAIDVVDVPVDARWTRMHFDWLEASEGVQRTVGKLSKQLRKYLDDQAWLENKRIMEIIKNIEQVALTVRSSPPPTALMTVDGQAPKISGLMDRSLFSPPFSPSLPDQPTAAESDDINLDRLYDQFFIDQALLQDYLRQALSESKQISLSELVEQHPLSRGLAELVAWLGLAAGSAYASIDERNNIQVVWEDAAGMTRCATLPYVVFRRPTLRDA